MSLKKQAIAGIKWSFAQQFSVQIINFAVQVILARLLMPEMFGLIAMIIVFISIGQTLMDSGMTSSLIRTKNPDQIDYSTVFITNFLMSILIYCFTYLSAPYIAQFYNQAVLIEIIRVFAITFVIRSLVAVHIAKLTKELNFKLQMKLQVPSTIIAGIVGVSMAYQGYGVWSLVFLNLIQTIVFTIQTWMFVKWRPSLIFNKDRFKYHFEFGYKLTLAGLIDVIYNDAYRIIIGKFFSPTSVGFFSHADTMRLFPVQQISVVMEKVTYPLFSSIESDQALKNAYRVTAKLIFFITVPAMLILILIAEEGFRVLFGEKWLPAVPYFQVLALASIVRPVSAYNLNILKVKGKGEIILKIEIIKKLIGIVLIFVGFPFHVMGLAVSLTLFSFISFFINMHYSGKLISYSIKEQLKDVVYFLAVGVFIFILLYIVKFYLKTYIFYDSLIVISFGVLFTTLYVFVLLRFDKEIGATIKSLIKS